MIQKIICEYCKKTFDGEVRNSYKQRFCSKSCVKKFLWATDEFREKQKQGYNSCSDALKALWKSKIFFGMTGKKHTEESKTKMKQNRSSNGDFPKGHTPWNKGLTKFTDDRVATNGERTGESLKGRKQTPEHIANTTKGLTGLKRSPESIERYKLAAQKRCREDMNYWKNLQKSLNLKPNNKERELDSVIQNLFPNEYKYVGDLSFILGGKNPDFMNVNGRKKLLELYGTYWHKDDDPQERIDYFKQFGFDTLVVWENELKDIDKLKTKLKKFHSRSKEVIDVI